MSFRQLRRFCFGRRTGGDLAIALAAVVLVVVLIGRPLAACRYPMITDLPMHAADASVVRHYLDAEWHFREQFELQPLAVPYATFYVLAAAFMVVLSPLAAVKLALVVMLAMLPAGLAVLCWGLRKSPLLGLCGLALVWSHLTHWGFINYLAAIGMMAMALGLTLRQLDQPSPRVRRLLLLVLFAIFVTHPFRFPMTIALVALTVIVMFPATRRVRPVLGPLLLAAGGFAVWWLLCAPPELGGSVTLAPELSRVEQMATSLYGSYSAPPDDLAIAGRAKSALIIAGLLLAVVPVISGRAFRVSRRERRWYVCSHAAVAASAALLLVLYFSLPMQIGKWWYIYPRELSAALLVALALVPNLPRPRLFRAAFVVVVALFVLPFERVTREHYQRFDRQTEGFAIQLTRLPRAPKLLFLVFDHSGATLRQTPFIHLPAYAQAEKGGWLSFQWATLGHSPIAYRSDADAVVPPAVPLRWEWTPHRFRVERHGAFFDWFLVRSAHDPARHFRRDPSIAFVAREELWWLYRRVR